MSRPPHTRTLLGCSTRFRIATPPASSIPQSARSRSRASTERSFTPRSAKSIWLGRAVGSRSRADAGELRQAIAGYVKQGNKISVPSFLGLLAECEADTQDVEAAFATIEEALARATETGQYYADAFLHCVRGDIPLKRDPVDTAPAEEAYKTAMAVATERGAHL